MLCCELCELLEKGCILLRKWRRYSQTVLETINNLKEPTDTTDLLHQSDNPKTGVHWSTEKDTLHVSTTPVISDRSIITNRTVASDLAQVFDVLGLLSPVVLVSKKIVQRLWQLQLGWNDPIPTDVLKDWTRWKTELHSLSDLAFKR